jgi:DNA-directed RNA polymerase subunit L|tara:strand:+ start:637 stop:1581 length:945 start_codon:yes stop_codon:yes gene_type:complete
MKDVDLSILNGIRRVLLMDIPILGFIGNGIDSTVNIIKNTTVLNNEIIANRIALIPLDITEEYNDKFIFDENKFEIELNESCSETEGIKLITTKNLIVKQDGKEIKNFFKSPIMITKLRKNEELHLKAEAVKETGRKNASFNIISGITVFNKPKNEFVKTKSIIEQERDYIDGEYIFEFELINNTISHKYMLLKAIDVLINKLVTLIDKATIEKYENNNLTYDFNIPDENDTIGNIIQSYVFNNYVIPKKKTIDNIICTYVGYIVKHPLEKVLTIRMTLNEEKGKEYYMNLMKNICNEIIENKLHLIKETFLKQ